MTHNQIDYWNLVENRRHNQAGEKISQQDADTRSGTLLELNRHNIAEEGLSLASINQQDVASQRATSAQIYSSDNARYASQYASDVSAATQRYGYDVNAATQRYGYDLNAETQRYNSENSRFVSMYQSDTNKEIAKYNADISQKNVETQTEATKRGQDVNAAMNLYNNLTSAANAWLDKNTNLLNYLGKINVRLGGQQ